MKLVLALFLLSPLVSTEASTIAIVDSGLDYKHEMIKPNLWANPNEVTDRRDNDGNGYQDDVYGWNFAEQNGQIIDYKYLGTFSPDCRRFFDIQGKRFLNQATESELEWMKTKAADAKFIAELSRFGNFVHGTHVAGIAIRNSKHKAMGIKLLPTETKLFFERMLSNKSDSLDRWGWMATAFNQLAIQQMRLLSEISKFATSHRADILNGSFGTGFAQAKMISDKAFMVLFFRKPTLEESNKAAALFMNALISQGKHFVTSAPNILFVFAAGNDGTNNDMYPTSPANIRADNVITVAATYKNEFLAPFSNYGSKMVDVAAPGMLINSAIPGKEYMKVSGTSQASPFVANVAAQIKEENPALRPFEVKKILMETVDKVGYLIGKVASGGIVNFNRAVVAAKLSKSVSLSEAIYRAKTSVRNLPMDMGTPSQNPKIITPIPLTPMFN